MEFLRETVVVDNLHLRKIREGKTEIFVPDPFYYVKRKNEYMPTSLPVFYNPVMEVNRDLSLLAIKAYMDLYWQPKKEDERILYIEALAGTGIRGFRVLNEIKNPKVKVLLNDINKLSIKIMKFNASYLKIESDLTITNYDANYLFLRLRNTGMIPDIIEIDPYGSPARFIFNAVRCIKGKGGLLLVTATDTAPLVGKFIEAAMRKYGCFLVKSPFSKEMAVRALIYFIGREASILARRIVPLFAIFSHHFIKLALLVLRGRKEADKFWKEIGWVSFCNICTQFYFSKGLQNRPRELCEMEEHGLTEIIGPLWLGRIFEEEFSREMLKKIDELSVNPRNAKLIKRIFEWELEAIDIPFFYDLQEIARRLRMSIPSINSVINSLKSRGYKASRTHFNPRGIKTNAKVRDIVILLKHMVNQ